jgi:hypothetical protein
LFLDKPIELSFTSRSMTSTAFVPDLTLTRSATADAPNDKLGGLPDGLPARLWPVCAECECPMSLHAQFDHADGRLDLGRPGRRLFVFQCAEPESIGACETWDHDSGANAAVIVEPEDLLAVPTQLPRETTPVLSEVHVREWKNFQEQMELDKNNDYRVHEGDTRLGGEPNWVQGDDEIDQDDWRFVAQLSERHRFLTTPVEDHPELRRFDTISTMEAGNYGGGIAYVFIERKPSGPTPAAKFFWQC